jgi:type 1 glutamine amidotransferase
MAQYPVTILAKANQISAADKSPWMTETIQQSFLDYVQRGNGLLVLHAGTAGYENEKILRMLMGGVFREHPEQCPVTVEPRASHPLTKGSETFVLVDEHYFMDLDDDQADVFLTIKSEHGAQPGGWTRTEGDGRVCVLTPGHNLEVWRLCADTRSQFRSLASSGISKITPEFVEVVHGRPTLNHSQ